MKEKLFFKQGETYPPLHPKVDPITGNFKLWYGYNEKGLCRCLDCHEKFRKPSKIEVFLTFFEVGDRIV